MAWTLTLQRLFRLQSFLHGQFDSHACLSYISSCRMRSLLWIFMLSAFILALFTGPSFSGAAAGCVEASSPWGSLLTQDHDALRWRTWENKHEWTFSRKCGFLKDFYGDLGYLIADCSEFQDSSNCYVSRLMRHPELVMQSTSSPDHLSLGQWRQHNLSFPAMGSCLFDLLWTTP